MITRGKRAVSYCRVSTNKEDQLKSLNNQIDSHKDYTKRYNCISVDSVGMLYKKDGTSERLEGIYADEGLSATKTKYRQAFNQMLQDAKLGKFEIIFVKNVQRWARSSEDFSKSIKDLKECNVAVIFVEGNLNTFSESAELTLQFLAAAAQDESRSKSSSIRFGIRKAQKQGKWTNSTIPYGYDRQGENLVINPEEEKVVKRIFDMYHLGGYGYTKIAKSLNDEGLKTKKGKGWTVSQISNMISNQLYKGVLVQHKTETFDINRDLVIPVPKEQQIVHEFEHLKIIDSEMFDLIQQEKERRGKEWGHFETQKIETLDSEGKIQIQNVKVLKRGVGNSSSKHLFSSLLKCGNCGGAMTRRRHRSRNDKFEWICQTNDKKGRQYCGFRNAVSEEDLLTFVQQEIIQHRSGKEGLEAHFRQHIYTYYDVEEAEGKIAPIENEITEIKKQTDRLLILLVNGNIDEEQFAEMNNERQEKIKALDSEKRHWLSMEHEVKVQEMKFNQFKIFLDSVDVDNLTNGILKQLFINIRLYTFPEHYRGMEGIPDNLRDIIPFWWFLGKAEYDLAEDMYEKDKRMGFFDEFEDELREEEIAYEQEIETHFANISERT